MGVAVAVYMPTMSTWYFCGGGYCSDENLKNILGTATKVSCTAEYGMGGIIYAAAAGCALIAFLLALLAFCLRTKVAAPAPPAPVGRTQSHDSTDYPPAAQPSAKYVVPEEERRQTSPIQQTPVQPAPIGKI